MSRYSRSSSEGWFASLGIFALLAWFLVMVCSIYGYVHNILVLVHTGLDHTITLEMGLRLLGIICFPLGIIMGLFF